MKHWFLPLIAGLLAALPIAAVAAPVDRAGLVAKLCGDAGQMGEAGTALASIAATGDDADRTWAAALPRAAIDRKLACDEAGAVLTEGGLDAVTRAPREAQGTPRSPLLSLKNRPVFELADAAFALRTAPNAGQRAAALKILERRPALIPEGLLERAAQAEADAGLKAQIENLAQSAALNASDPAARIRAIGRVAENTNRRTLTQLTALKNDPAYGADAGFRQAVDAGISRVERGIAIGDVMATLYNGLSFASILFMAAIGLAIIFGLMGVINLAQGELIMIGAYVTWLVQQGLRSVAPGLLDWYLILAIPAAFLVTAAIGIALEAALLRHLYKRPLMSLLATWAVSLFLVNLVRVIFGTQNLQFETPFYVTGGVPVIGDFIFTWNRMFAILFAVVTLALTWLVVRKTPLGLNIRAVTQNRDMAACIGIPTRRVDMMAFGLGSGLAGLAGLALSPIYSVNPQMGQNFIIDSFMVVVLGGVGTIAGTVVAALGIGQINVLIEPLWGAVAAKVIVLLMIIGFLQWRPEGLFAVKGRRK
ncbi:urea ABC transporter, permease protein UrtB [Ancylobacter novellus DSM 506]|uniref:Urea ABC transporter, permease protein UrtB n=1 Tax=Ancylobacter novellus (strain ATCC 8093 / DSM 506 / JCM 20403 / CCM 1077 / IAM 12100 / NBRC 12443 / NCIMB 10456) TaxID=639283 RepID=D7A1I1_ANCN5|nr:urea ABC transporter permease subunit UrtB [Ancylobacter novellus]ADH91406.1 urea ABC transporter, permease protein UrtB [Ancylobacter novellus DSM 506]